MVETYIEIILAVVIGIFIGLYRVCKKLDNLENRIEYIESIDGEDIKKMLEESENE